MDNKGQISAEYLLLMVIIILILSSVTIPLASKSIDASNDVSQVADAKTAVESLAAAANAVYANGPGAKRILYVYIPKDNTKIVTGRNGSKGFISTNVTLSDGTTKTVVATTEYPLYAYTWTVPSGSRKAKLEWYTGDSALQNWVV